MEGSFKRKQQSSLSILHYITIKLSLILGGDLPNIRISKNQMGNKSTMTSSCIFFRYLLYLVSTIRVLLFNYLFSNCGYGVLDRTNIKGEKNLQIKQGCFKLVYEHDTYPCKIVCPTFCGITN